MKPFMQHVLGIAFTLTLFSVGLDAAATNLLENGDFSRVHPSGAPDGWRIMGKGKGGHEVTVDYEVTYEDKYALRLTAKGAPYNHANRIGGVTVYAKSFPVVPGQAYELSYSLKTAGLHEVRDAKGAAPGARFAHAIFYLLDADGKYVANDSLYHFADLSEFERHKLTVTAPARARLGRIQLWLTNYSSADVANAWFSDLRVNAVRPAPADADPPPSGRRLYTGEAETINQHREERYLENYALLSKGATASANSVLNEGTRHGHPAPRAIDGDAHTGWVGKVRDKHEGAYVLKVTLAEPQLLRAVYWVRYPSEQHRDRAPEAYTIKVSADGVEWDTVAQVSGYGYSNRYENFKPIQVRHVVMEIDRVQVQSRNGPEIKELRVLGLKKGATEDYCDWWDRNWHFRTRLKTPEKGVTATRSAMNFTDITDTMAGAFLEESVRVIRSSRGQQVCVPCLFIKSGDYDARNNASGTLLFIQDGDPTAVYHCYFDTDTHGAKTPPDSRVPGVQFVPSFTAEGWMQTVKIESGAIQAVTIHDDRNKEVATITAQTDRTARSVPLSFDHEYYARLVRRDGTTAYRWLSRPVSRALPANLQCLQLARSVFVRNEDLEVKTILNNQSDGHLDTRLTVGIRDEAGRVWYRHADRARMEAGKTWQTTALFRDVNLRPGKYAVVMEVRGKDNTFLTAARQTAIDIVEDKPIKFLYGIFGPGRVTPGHRDWLPTLKAMAAAGINAVTGNDIAMMDDYLRHGLKAIGKIGFQLPFAINDRPADYAAVDQHGDFILPPYKGDTWYPNYTHPAVKAGARQAFKDYVAGIKDHPGFSGYIFSNDDYQLPAFRKGKAYRMCGYSETDRARFKELTGTEPPRPEEVEVKRGIIPDDDLWARFVRFRCEELFANGNNKLRVDAKNEIAPEVKFGNVHGPMQDNFYVPLAGLYPPADQAVCDFVGGYSYLNQWREWKRYTTYGDLCRMGRRNRARGRELIMLPPLGACTMGFSEVREGLYEKGDHLSSDWAFRNQVYQLLAGGFNGLWFYVWDHAGRNPTHKPKLLAEVTRMGKLLRDYGPLLRSIHTSDKPVGVFVSITDTAYGSWFLPSSRHRNRNGCWLPDTLLKAHVPAETFCEEEVMDGILDKYEVVVVYDVMVMKESIARKLETYVARGGTVLLAGSDDIMLKGAERVPLDRRRRGRDLAERLRELVTPFADTGSDEITIREFDDTKVRYLFIVDCFFDKYCYNVRGAHPEWWDGSKWLVSTIQIKPRRETITLAQKYEYAVDIFNRKEVQLTPTATGAKFTLDLEPGGGKLIALYPQPVDTVIVTLPKRIRAGDDFEVAVQVLGADAKPFVGNLPVALDLYDAAGSLSPMSSRYVVRNGTLRATMRTALNELEGAMKAQVTDLATGKVGEARLLVP